MQSSESSLSFTSFVATIDTYLDVDDELGRAAWYIRSTNNRGMNTPKATYAVSVLIDECNTPGMILDAPYQQLPHVPGG